MHQSMNERVLLLGDDKLIALVRDQPGLYDRKNVNFTNEIFKEECWRIIANNLSSTPADCITKWMILRQKFIAEKENEIEVEMREGKLVPSEWEYMKDMRFMEPHVTLRVPSSIMMRLPKSSKISSIFSSEYFSEDKSCISVCSNEPEESKIETESQINQNEVNESSALQIDSSSDLSQISKAELSNNSTIAGTLFNATENYPDQKETEIIHTLSSECIEKSGKQEVSTTAPCFLKPKVSLQILPPSAVGIHLEELTKFMKSMSGLMENISKKHQELLMTKRSHCTIKPSASFRSLNSRQSMKTRIPFLAPEPNSHEQTSKSSSTGKSDSQTESNSDDLFGRLIAAELRQLGNDKMISYAKILILKVVYKLRLGEPIILKDSYEL